LGNFLPLFRGHRAHFKQPEPPLVGNILFYAMQGFGLKDILQLPAFSGERANDFFGLPGTAMRASSELPAGKGFNCLTTNP
jgi:hypothetical protein